KPLTSVTVIPDTPAWARASRTSSSLNGRMMAVISFMFASRWWRSRPGGRRSEPGAAGPAGPARPVRHGRSMTAAAHRFTDCTRLPWGEVCRPVESRCFPCSCVRSPLPEAARFPGRAALVGCGCGSGAGFPPAPLRSVAVVELVLQRVGRRAEAGDLLHLQRDVAVDEVVAHHAAGLEELAVRVQRLERLVQARAHLRDVLLLLRRQVVQVLVGGRARVD